MSRALDYLLASQKGDGGWGYQPTGMSFVEPTAAAILALSQDVKNRVAVQRARTYLRMLQRADGGWGIAAVDDESGWMTAWAVWALASGEAADMEPARQGAAWLLKSSGFRVTDPGQVQGVEKVLHIDPRITGWAWQPGDAAWIFPTALSLLALDAMQERDHPRVTEGIQYLLDRAIATGGWNIGNPFMVTGNMPPTVENTSLALIALHAFQVESEKIQRAADWLARDNFTSTPFEWAWRAWYWKETNRTVDKARLALNALQDTEGSWDRNPFTTSVVLLALGAT